ncbi:MAG: hypothetical protein ACI31M_00165 [Bacilli bacterium]
MKNYYPMVKGQLNSYYDYNKIIALQRLNVEGKMKIDSPKKSKSDAKIKTHSSGPSLILRRSPRSTNRGK